MTMRVSMMLTMCLTDSSHTCGSFLDLLLIWNLLLIGNAYYLFSPVILYIIHCINLEYNGGYYLKVLWINFVILRVSGLMEYGMYLLYKCPLLSLDIPFTWYYCGTHTYHNMLQITFAKVLHVAFVFCQHLSRIMFGYCSKYEHTKDTLI